MPESTTTSEPSRGVEYAWQLLSAGHPIAAIDRCRALLAADDNDARTWLVLAQALLIAGRAAETLDAADAALDRMAETACAWFLRGTALACLGETAAAAIALRRAAALDPSDGKIQLNLGNALTALDQLEAAETALVAARALSPSAEAHASLAALRLLQARPHEALAGYQAALVLQPDNPAITWDFGFTCHLTGDSPAGWWAWRVRKPEEQAVIDRLPLAGPEWTGQGTPKHLLVISTQGLGDAIQFARYLPLPDIAATLVCAPGLVPLLAQLVATSPDTADCPDHDAWTTLADLPRLLPPFPMPVPYLSAIPATPSAPGIGLAWTGNAHHLNNARRSLPPGLLDPLLAVTGRRFVSLQPGHSTPAGIVDLGGALTDLAATASVISGLDLVVTVDTVVAHLAGALGKPVWILLPYSPDWRWGLNRDATPWYPAARLFRQPAPGDWPSVVAAVISALKDPEWTVSLNNTPRSMR